MLFGSLKREKLKLLFLVMLIGGQLRFDPMLVRAGTACASFNHAVEDGMGSLVKNFRWVSYTALLLLRVIDKASCRFGYWIEHGLSAGGSHYNAIGISVLLVKSAYSLSLRVAVYVA